MYSFTEIWQRIRDRLQNEASRIEGTFTMDNVQAVAQELAMIHDTEIESLIDRAMLDTATGEDLDRCVADFGEARRPAVGATGILLFMGTPRTYIPLGTKASALSLLFSTLAAVRIDDAGGTLVRAQCDTSGTVGNVPANTITSLVARIDGVDSVTNPFAFEGGADEEDDETLRERVFEKIRFPITSGNEYYYEYLAKQVPGVGQAICFATWAGPGTAKVTVLAADNAVPDETLLQRIRDHVTPQKLIGCDLTIAAAKQLTVNFDITVRLRSSYIIAEVEQPVRDELAGYFADIAFDKATEYLSYHKMIELVFRVDGIADITTLTMNGQDETLPIGAEEFCALGGVIIRAAD